MKPGQHIILTTTDSHVDGIIVRCDGDQVTVNDEIGALVTDIRYFTITRDNTGAWILEQ